MFSFSLPQGGHSSVRLRFADGAVPVFSSGGERGSFCVSAQLNGKGRFRFQLFLFLENGSCSSGSVKNNSDGSGFRFRSGKEKGTPKNFCDKDSAELSGELSGAICLKTLVLLGSALEFFRKFFGAVCAIFWLWVFFGLLTLDSWDYEASFGCTKLWPCFGQQFLQEKNLASKNGC